ncbi:MAG: FHA domain-containing protein [Oscillospiraceae bacterium]|jgi:hypothetical protein|nr:FHA domain-containing protein [Oscillospiraceae bacterium]
MNNFLTAILILVGFAVLVGGIILFLRRKAVAQWITGQMRERLPNLNLSKARASLRSIFESIEPPDDDDRKNVTRLRRGIKPYFSVGGCTQSTIDSFPFTIGASLCDLNLHADIPSPCLRLTQTTGGIAEIKNLSRAVIKVDVGQAHTMLQRGKSVAIDELEQSTTIFFPGGKVLTLTPEDAYRAAVTVEPSLTFTVHNDHLHRPFWEPQEVTHTIGTAGYFLIGRDPKCDLPLPFRNDDISREHLRLQYDAAQGYFAITSLTSRVENLIKDGTPLPNNVPQCISSGEVYELGDGKILLNIDRVLCPPDNLKVEPPQPVQPAPNIERVHSVQVRHGRKIAVRRVQEPTRRVGG